jgi:hypothetical protein
MNYLPDIYKEFQQQFPEVARVYDELASKCHDWGPLEEKTRRLIKLGVAMGLNSEGSVNWSRFLSFFVPCPDATEPLVKSTCWLANCSAGAPHRLRPVIETALLPMLAGAGLYSVFLDILRKENRQAARLVKIFNNEVVYSDSELEP